MFEPVQAQGLPEGFWTVDFSSTFQAGMIGGLTVVAGEVVITTANGIDVPPYGIIDDSKDTSFMRTVRDDIVIIPVQEIIRVLDGDGDLTNAIDVTGNLNNANIIASAFSSDTDISLNTTNGTVTVEAGTKLNFDLDGDGILDSFKIVCSYAFRVSNIPGDDTTMASGKVTVWNARGTYMTDMYEPNVPYPLNATLFCSCNGKFTTTPPCEGSPGVAMVTGPPSSLDGSLMLLWF